MKAWIEELMDEKVGLQIAPLIDVVFLLLIYFMVTASLKRSEADLRISLPSQVSQTQPLEMPDEQIIEVLPDGQIILNGTSYNDSDKKDLEDLAHTLRRYRDAAAFMKTHASITIVADDNSRHERVVDVLNACAGADIKSITFGNTE